MFDGHDITNRPTYRNVRDGLAFIPERPGSVLMPLTVRENLQLGGYSGRGQHSQLVARSLELFPILAMRASQIAGTLSGGEQQMLAIARDELVLVRKVIAALKADNPTGAQTLLSGAGPLEKRYNALANSIGLTVCGRPTP